MQIIVSYLAQVMLRQFSIDTLLQIAQQCKTASKELGFLCIELTTIEPFGLSPLI